MSFDIKTVELHEDDMALVRDEGLTALKLSQTHALKKSHISKAGSVIFSCRRAFFSMSSRHSFGGTEPAEFGNLRGEIRLPTPRI